jgi:hypothetical protein
MNSLIIIPDDPRSAGSRIRLAIKRPLNQLSHEEFIGVWSSLAYLFPGLHPDGFEDKDSGWPLGLQKFATEAWDRFDRGELADEELYASDAAWAGLCDQMTSHTDLESERRKWLKEQFGDGPDLVQH